MYKISPQNLKPYLQPTHQCVSSKFILPILPLGGDTPFYAFGYEIEDFCSMDKLMRRDVIDLTRAF